MSASNFFSIALELAKRAAKRNEVPIGAVLVKDGRIVARASNQTEKKGSFLAHAEMLCIMRASKKLRTKYLAGCSLYITLEPCRMCETAAQLSRIDEIHYLLRSNKFGRRGPAYRKIPRKIHRGAARDDAATLLKNFFEKKRLK